MAKKAYILGHRRQIAPATPVPMPRRSPEGGWKVSCVCGWQGGNVQKRIDGEQRYRDHLATVQPTCGACDKTFNRADMSKGSPHLCKPCAKEKFDAWRKANPSKWLRSRRNSYLKKEYGITVDEYEALLASQGGLCAICSKPPDDSRGYRPHVDHCHATGRVRGILCYGCNSGIGSLKDDPEIVRKALTYLLFHQADQEAA